MIIEICFALRTAFDFDDTNITISFHREVIFKCTYDLYYHN